MVAPQRSHLEKQALWRADETVIYDAEDDAEISYRKLNDLANRAANALHDRGVRYSDRVALLVHNTIEFPVFLYGCFKLGAVPVALNYRFTSEDIAHVLDTVNEQAIVFDTEFEGLVTDATERTHSDAALFSVGDSGVGTPVSTVLDTASSEAPPPISRSSEDISYMFCTSGTTGAPKVVTHTVRSGRERLRVSIAESGTTPESVWIAFLPWFHGSGIDTVVRASITAGAAFVAMKDYSDPAEAISAIEEYPVSHVMTVPTLSDRFVEEGIAGDVDFGDIECWRHTGEVLTASQIERFREEITPNIYNSYGSSESGLNTMLRPADLPEHAGSVGRPVVGDDIRLIELDTDRHVEPDETVSPGEKGEIIVRSEQLFFGYFEDREKTTDRVYDGWYYTHDVGVIEEGYLYVEGRTDDMILSGGELVSAIEVEDALKTHANVNEVVVVGAPDSEWGERVVAFVDEQGAVSADELDDYLRENDVLADYKRPREYQFVSAVERAGSGKKRRSKYRELARQT